MNIEDLTAEDLVFLPAGSVVAIRKPGVELRHFEATKHKHGLWSCTACRENHTSEDLASFKMKMRLKEMGDPEVGETIVAEHVGVADHFPVGTRLQDADRYDDMCWQRVEGGWVYDPEDFFENPYRTPHLLKEDYAPYTVLPKAETRQAEQEDDTVMAYTDTEPEKEETVKTYPREEATKMTDKRFIDDRGGLWGYSDGFWYFGMSEKVLQDKIDGKQAGITWKSLPIGGSEFYTLATESEEEAELPRLNEKGDAPEKREFTAAEASRMRGVIFQDAYGDFWKNFDGDWKFISAEYPKYLYLDEDTSGLLSPDYEPYTFLGYKDDDLVGENEIPRFAKNQEEPKKAGLIDAFEISVLSSLTATPAMEYHFSTDAGPAFLGEVTRLSREEDIEVEKTESLTVEDLLEKPDQIYFDAEGDLWGCRDGKWAWGRSLSDLDRKLSGRTFLHDKPLGGSVGPYRVAECVTLPKTETDTDTEPEEEKTPTITESLNKIAKSLERIAKALEEK